MTPRPPRVARLLASVLLRTEAREIVIGDLDEEFARAIAAGIAPRRARLRYWRQAVASIAACTQARIRGGRDDRITERKGRGPAFAARGWANGLSQDVRFALRLFRREKAAVAIVVAGLTVAIGLCTALLTVMNAMLFRTLHVDDAASLRWVRQTGGARVTTGMPSSAGTATVGVTVLPAWTLQEVDYLREHTAGARVAGALQSGARLETDDGIVEPLAPVWFVTAEFFQMTGARAAAGRLLAPTDDAHATAAPVVMNHAFWTRRFGGTSGVLGRTVRLNGRPFTVVGIAARRYVGPTHEPPAFWAPLSVYDLDWRDGARLGASDRAGWSLLAKLTPGSTAERLQAELSTLVRGLRQSGGADAGEPAVEIAALDPDWRVRGGTAISTIVMILIAFVLLLGCGNVANLLVAGAASRQGEIGVRLALGASRGRIVRQMLTESLVLGLFSAAGGLLLAIWLTPLVAGIADVRSTFDIAPDARTYAFLGLAAAVTGLAAGLAPARYGARGDLRSTLGIDAARAPAATGRFNTVVIAMQAAIAMLMLVLGASLTRGAWRASTLDIGFDPDRLLEVRWPVTATVAQPPGQGIQELAAERLRTLPVVERVALSRFSPLAGSHHSLGIAERGGLYRAYLKEVSSDYFATLGVAIEQGRTFSAAEIATGAPVAIVAARIARDFWPAADPVGDRMDRVHRSLAGVHVIGVAADVLPYSLLDAAHDTTAIYRPLPRADQGLRVLVLRTRGSAAGAVPDVRAVLLGLDPQSRPSISLTSDVVTRQVRAAAVPSKIATISIAAILALAAIGIYGLTVFTIGRRRREIAVRMALGASRRAILQRVLRDGFRPIIIGLVAGIALAWLAGRWMSTVLFGIPAHDPLSIVAALALLLGITAAAILTPARSAAGLDPARVLRQL